MTDFTVALGALFALMTLAHFVFDWLPQAESWAVVKHREWDVRLLHSLFYSLPMAVLLYMVTDCSIDRMNIALIVLLVSHFFEDTYWFPAWWYRNVRQGKGPMYEGFNLVLVIMVDQIVHLVTLLVACTIAIW